MATTLRTPTRTLTLTLVDPRTGVDWSGDYVGNHYDTQLHRDKSGRGDYITTEVTADWWVDQCERQQRADNAMAELTSDQRDAVHADPRLACDLADLPEMIMAAIVDATA